MKLTKETLDSIDKDTWIVSDLHFGHKTITKFEPGRLQAMKEAGFECHEDWLVHNWNSVVKPEDTVLCLGDFAFNGVEKYTKLLNGNKILILGNHDGSAKNTKYMNWAVLDGIYIHGEETAKLMGYEYDSSLSALVKEIDDIVYMFSHYPVFDDNQYDRRNPKILPRMKTLEKTYDYFECDFSIHGHTHSKNSTFVNSINVSLEHLKDFKPQRLGDIL